jgi:phosphocarrier protein
MTTKTVKILNKIGLHARPASMLVNAAGKFQSKIILRKGDRSADAKSMINLLTLRVKMDDMIQIEAEGTDEAEAAEALAALVQSKFGEE